MSDSREDEETTAPEPPAGRGDLSDSGEEFDEVLHDAEAEADDTFGSERPEAAP